jgi:hypothetical protein
MGLCIKTQIAPHLKLISIVGTDICFISYFNIDLFPKIQKEERCLACPR